MSKALFLIILLFANFSYAYKGDFSTSFSVGSFFFPNTETGEFTSDSKFVKNGNFNLDFDNKFFALEGAANYEITDIVAIAANGIFVQNKVNTAFIPKVSDSSGTPFDHSSNVACGFINVTMKFDNKLDIAPFLGIGAGMSSVSFFIYNSINLAYQGFAGMELPLTSNVLLTSYIRYIQFNKVNFKVSSVSYIDSLKVKQTEAVDGRFEFDSIKAVFVNMGIKFVF
ncbi:exported hypothetical protein [Candidatus Xenohaliotis californiensis]|uniref:Outer membrane protein n=1 Tax=Candidatus Xenohaliotis californiensis TaxID=84677 RepID=A0ABM9N8R7_9RICK|nr:exported hypothetical protein [Candidatus Xenohaliotis californiensis]